MAFAPLSEVVLSGEPLKIKGFFRNKETDVPFEFSEMKEGEFNPWDQPHKIWVKDGFRYGKVLKTAVWIVVDEGEFGNPMYERWDIKQHREYK